MILTLLKNTDELFCRIFFSPSLSDFLKIILKLLGRLPKRVHVLLRAYQIMLLLTIGEINFDHLVKMASASLLYCKCTTLSFVITDIMR